MDFFFPVENKRTPDCPEHAERVQGQKWQERESQELGTYNVPGTPTIFVFI